jgi:hypothetical protein
MVLTLTEVSRTRGGLGNKNIAIYDITFDSSYPTGGEALVPSDIGFDIIDYFTATSDTGYHFMYNYSTTLEAWWADNNASSDTALVEVANTTNLSAVVVRTMFIGV